MENRSKKERSGKELKILLQTGPLTPPDFLVHDLETIDGISIDQRRLGVSLLSGGVASFLMIETNNDSTALLAEALYQHSKRLKMRGIDDLVILLGGVINTSEEVIGFRDVHCRKQVSLKGKSQDEIRKIVEESV